MKSNGPTLIAYTAIIRTGNTNNPIYTAPFARAAEALGRVSEARFRNSYQKELFKLDLKPDLLYN